MNFEVVEVIRLYIMRWFHYLEIMSEIEMLKRIYMSEQDAASVRGRLL